MPKPKKEIKPTLELSLVEIVTLLRGGQIEIDGTDVSMEPDYRDNQFSMKEALGELQTEWEEQVDGMDLEEEEEEEEDLPELDDEDGGF